MLAHAGWLWPGKTIFGFCLMHAGFHAISAIFIELAGILAATSFESFVSGPVCYQSSVPELLCCSRIKSNTFRASLSGV